MKNQITTFEFVICSPKDPPPKFQPSIRSKTSRIRSGYDLHYVFFFLTIVWVRADLLRIED
jgi:hypothetical protein